MAEAKKSRSARNIDHLKVTQETKKKVLAKLAEVLDQKLSYKGDKPFRSMPEIYGKLQEENYETLVELHARNHDKFCSELLDVAIVALFGIMSVETWQD